MGARCKEDCSNSGPPASRRPAILKPDKVGEASHPPEAGYLGAVAKVLDPNAALDHFHQPRLPDNTTPLSVACPAARRG